MSKRDIRNVAVGLALLAAVALGGYKLGQQSILSNSGEQMDLSMMWQVKDKLTAKYLDKSKIDNKKMSWGAIGGMVASLGDPYTVYLPPKENNSSKEDLAGTFGGVGISLGYKDKTLAVMSILPKTPAEKAGLKSGDLILKIIDKEKKIDKDTTGIALEEAVDLIRGKLGTEVTLKMYREGGKATFDTVLKRDNIVVPSIELEWKTTSAKKQVAWVKLYKFTDLLYQEWPDMVAKIKQKEGSDFGGIVLDLRNNPGGFLEASVLVASDFLNDGVVVKQESSDGKTITYTVDKGRRNLTSEKLVVLINGGSASAAEILAGALHERGRAKLIGEKSFGKGTVQQPEDFPDGSGLHITIAKWLLPSGKNIHGTGVDPDVVVKPGDDPKVDDQLNKAIESL